MKMNREFLKWACPQDNVILPLDFMLSMGIMGIAIAIALVSYVPLMTSAKLTEVWTAAVPAKYALVEHLALTGDTVDMPETDAKGVVTSVSADDHLSGRKEAKPQKLGLGSGDLAQAKKAAEANQQARESIEGTASKYVSSTRIVGNAIVIAGTIGGRQYDVGFYPAVVDEEPPAVYVWFCGRHQIPEGWLAQPPALSNPLPDNLIRECRRRRAS